MNALDVAGSRTFFRSMATRTAGAQVPEHLGDVIAAVQASGVDLVVVETPGIGQGDAAIVPFSDVSLYVMTPEFGAASQLEKIDMLDFADVVAINKFERRGAEDARRDVARQLVRNREAFGCRGSRCRSSAPAPPASTTTASPRSTSTCAACWSTRGWPRARASCRGWTSARRPG